MRELGTFGWDWDGPPLLILTKDHLVRVIDRFLSGEIDAVKLQAWAENLEVREDVAFDEVENELIDDAFFRLATPKINEPLTRRSVQEMKDRLAAKPANQSSHPTPSEGRG